MNGKILFSDFDGVLFDTILEVYLVNRYYFLGKDFFDVIEENEFKLFSKYKYLVYNIWMFYYYNPIIFDCPDKDKVTEDFNNALKHRNLEKEEEFCAEFLNIRKKLVEKHYDFWKTLEKPYEFFFEIKKLYEEKNVDIVVVSKKNKISILERFESYGFNLPENKVFAREILGNYSSKKEFMEEYMQKNNKKSAIFVDDNINNLKGFENSKIDTILALWGNNSPDDVGLNQNEAIQRIKDYFISR